MSQPNVTAHTYLRDTAPVNLDGKVVCYKHWEPAGVFTSTTVENPGREFFTCSRDRHDPERCKFFIWADDRLIVTAMESRSSERSAAEHLQSTPQRPSQARRAHYARTPATPMAVQKRPRTPSPPPESASANGTSAIFKQRRIDDEPASGTRTNPTTPALSPSQHAARFAEIQRALTDVKKVSRLQSIEEALSAVQGPSQDTVSSRSPHPSSPNPAQASPDRSSRRKPIEVTLQHARTRRHSDGSASLSPSSVSQNQDPASLHGVALPGRRQEPKPASSSQDIRSDAGHSISSEIERAEMEDIDQEWEEARAQEPPQDEIELEDKEIQTDPVDDEDSIIDDFFSASSSRSVLGSPVAYGPFSLPGGAWRDAPRELDLESDRVRWSPAPPLPQTPGGVGGNARRSQLLTPPGSAQISGYEGSGSAGFSHRGRLLGVAFPPPPVLGRLESPSPSPTKGKGVRRSSEIRSQSPWQMLQDDPENSFHGRAVALPAGPSTPTISSGVLAGNLSETGFWGASSPPKTPSADTIAEQITSLASIPEYMRRLERKERAAQKSVEIKTRRIAQLEEEVQRLRNEKRALEETVSALQMRR